MKVHTHIDWDTHDKVRLQLSDKPALTDSTFVSDSGWCGNVALCWRRLAKLLFEDWVWATRRKGGLE